MKNRLRTIGPLVVKNFLEDAEAEKFEMVTELQNQIVEKVQNKRKLKIKFRCYKKFEEKISKSAFC